MKTKTRILRCALPALMVCATSSAGCLTVYHSVEVELRSTEDVDLAVVRERGDPLPLDRPQREGRFAPIDDVIEVVRTNDGLRLHLGEVRWNALGSPGDTRGKPRTVVLPWSSSPPAKLPTRGDAFHWTASPALSRAANDPTIAALRAEGVQVDGQRVRIRASTPVANVARARGVNYYSDGYGGLPSCIMMGVGGVLGGAMAYATTQMALEGFGVTGDPGGDSGKLRDAAVSGTFAAALLTMGAYGAVSLLLIRTSPWVASIDVPPPGRVRTRADAGAPAAASTDGLAAGILTSLAEALADDPSGAPRIAAAAGPGDDARTTAGLDTHSMAAAAQDTDATPARIVRAPVVPEVHAF
jgi:hypothetical protein